jgi:hypothetical protein
MSYAKRKPSLNRKDTQTLLKTLKLATTAGALSLTLAGWGLLAHTEARSVQAAASQDTAIVAGRPVATAVASASGPVPTSQPVKKINVVQWVQDMAGNSVAVVQDRRGTFWYVMGSDIPRLEQGLSPLVQPQPVQIVTRTRAS